MNPTTIRGSIYDPDTGFAKVCHGATPFVDSGTLWVFCLQTVTVKHHGSKAAAVFPVPPADLRLV